MSIEFSDPSALELDGSQLEKLEEALLSAFPERAALERLVSHRMDADLDELVGKVNQSDAVQGLVKWAKAQGRLEELVQAAYVRVPGNPLLYAFAQQPRFRRRYLPGYDCDVFVSFAE